MGDGVIETINQDHKATRRESSRFFEVRTHYGQLPSVDFLPQSLINPIKYSRTVVKGVQRKSTASVIVLSRHDATMPRCHEDEIEAAIIRAHRDIVTARR